MARHTGGPEAAEHSALAVGGDVHGKDTVNAAPREIVDRRRRAAAVARMRAMAAEGEIDFSVIEKKDDGTRQNIA